MVKDGHDALQKCLDYLEIKEDEKIDVVRSKYKRRPDESIKIVQTKLGMHFENVLSDAFCRNGCLCLANYVERVDIPLREMTGIKKIDRRAGMSDWNRNVKWDSGEYARYNIKLASGGGIIMPCYYALCISHGGEDYEMYFPPYDLEAVKRLTGITVITE